MTKAQDGQDPLPMQYRYDVNPVPSYKTNCFKPNPLTADADMMNLKPGNIGAVFASQFHRLQRSKRADVVWEVTFPKLCLDILLDPSVEAKSLCWILLQVEMRTGAPTRCAAIKPKYCLLSCLRLPPKTWVCLSVPESS